jgi:putative phosphoribosyl transferase
MFRDRAEAGEALAAALAPLVTRPCVVAAVPRGGVAVAHPVATRFQVPLTLVYARKLTAPVAPELAFGALDEDGETSTDPMTIARLGLTAADVQQAKARARAEIDRRQGLYGVSPLARHLPGAGVVLVDDGIATGLTLRAALLYARRHGAREVIVATPCAAAAAAARFRRAADHFVALVVEERFTAVGAYYREFPQLSDGEVLALLARGPAPPAAVGGPG